MPLKIILTLYLFVSLDTQKSFDSVDHECSDKKRMALGIRDRYYDFVNIFAKENQRKNWRFLLETKLNYEKIDHNISFFRKTPIVSPKIGENRGKL
jgi:hypothetical protein